ncbi:MAG: O-antigen ligase family protein [Verrucomicrobiota bacterium]
MVAALVLIQVLSGGSRLLFSLPAYALLSLMGVLALFSLRQAKPNPDRLCLASAAIFLGYIIARAYFSPVDYMARQDLYSVLGGLLVYFFVASVLTGAKQRMIVLIILIAAAIGHVVVGTIQFTEGNNFTPLSFLGRADYGRRASGFYGCPNHLAGLLEVLGVFGLSIVCWSRWPVVGKVLVAYGTGICYAGLVLSGSRGGYLSTVTSLAIFAALSLTILARSSAKLFWRIGTPFVVGAIVVWIAVSFSVGQSQYLSQRTENVLGDDLNDTSSTLRTAMWQIALKQWALKPVWGTGSGTYLYYARQFHTNKIPGDPIYAHNDYVQLLGEYGLVGAAGFLLFIIFHLRRGWKNFERLGPKRVTTSVSPSLLSNGMALNIGALGAVGAYAVHSIFDFNLHVPANLLLMAFVFGVLANGGIPRGGEPRPPTWAALLSRIALPALGIIVAIQCARLLPGEYFAELARTTGGGRASPETSLRFAERGIETETRNPYLYQYLAAAETHKARLTSDAKAQESLYRNAVIHLEKAHALAPQDKAFALVLALAYGDGGRSDDSERMYKEAMALDPQSETLQNLYKMRVQKGQDEREIELQPKAAASPTDQK